MPLRPEELESVEIMRLISAVHRVQDNLMERFAQNLSGLTAGQMRILISLVPGRPTRTLELASRLYTDPGTVSGLLRRLTQKGLICTQQASEDRRVQLVSLSPTGEQVREKFLQRAPDELRTCSYLTDIGPVRRSQLLHMLREYFTYLVGDDEVDQLLGRLHTVLRA